MSQRSPYQMLEQQSKGVKGLRDAIAAGIIDDQGELSEAKKEVNTAVVQNIQLLITGGSIDEPTAIINGIQSWMRLRV